MIVLGVHLEHDSGAALMKDGEIIINVEAERVTGVKHADGLPAVQAAIRAALKQSGIRSEEVSAIAYSDCWLPGPCPAQLDRNAEIQRYTHGHEMIAFRGNLAESGFDRVLPTTVANFRSDIPVFLTCHSMSHAAGAVYMAGFRDACGLVFDAYGTCCGMMGYKYEEGALTRLEHWQDRYLMGAGYHRIGIICREINGTANLDVAGKVMGLQAYGSPVAEWVQYFEERFFSSSPETGYDDYVHWTQASHFCEEIFPGGLTTGSLSAGESEYCNLVASMQAAFTNIIANSVNQLVKETGFQNVFLSGGCAMNIISNTAVARCPAVRSLFVQPNCGDAGQAMGSAILAMRAMSGALLHRPEISERRRRDPYIGLSLSDDPAHALLSAGISRRPFTLENDMSDLARRLIAGQTVGLIRGPSEIGPRALGNRSILAHASVPCIKDTINGIKHREWWRPFAPVCRLRDAKLYFELPSSSRYMLMNNVVREHWRSKLAGITHVDGTARLQILERADDHPFLWNLLSEIEAQGEIPVLLNTSFNLGGKPLANTTVEAMELLSKSDLNCVVVEDHFFYKEV